MSTEYKIVCVNCKDKGPSFAAGSSAYGYIVWNGDEWRRWLGHGEPVGHHEGHDVRIVSENADLPWESEDA